MTKNRERMLRIASVLTVGGCAAAVCLTAALLGAASIGPGDPFDAGFAVGGAVGVPADLTDGSKPTLLVFLRTDCTASQSVAEWTPELRERLADEGILTVAVVSAAGGRREGELASAAGFDVSEVWAAEFGRLPLRAVPAFVLVDEAGRVVQQRAGAVDSGERAAFVDEILATRH